jgi:flagellar protein FlgJ
MSVSSPTDFYLNQQQYSEMKLGARNQSVETTKAVAEQFESLFVQQMLASMRSAVTIDESNESSTVDFYQEMYDKQLAVSISKQGGLGIAKMLIQHLPNVAQLDGVQQDVAQPGADQLASGQLTQLTGKGGNSLPIEAVPQMAHLSVANLPSTSLPMTNFSLPNLPVPNPPVTNQPVTSLAESNLQITYRPEEKESLTQWFKTSSPISPPIPVVYQTDIYQTQNSAVRVSQYLTDDLPAKSDAVLANQVGSEQRWGKPDRFVSDLWPHAQKAANAIGISAQALVAQSALETGWGKHSMRLADGQQAFNLFGIKADRRWDGPTLTKPTLEFRDGVMQTEIAHFRVYESIPAALDDYVEFIQDSSRYQNALDHKGDDTHYLRQLQQGGYATDPQYANKIINIMQGQTLGASLANLNANQSLVKENNHG